jgi:hypothetical protein
MRQDLMRSNDPVDAPGATRSPLTAPDWVARDRYQLLSASFNVYATDPAMAQSIRWLLDPFWLPFGEAAYSVEISAAGDDNSQEWPLYRCSIGGVVQTESWYRHDLVGAALNGMYQLVPTITRDFLLLHAGAVVRGDAALLLPGPPNSGKSSTTLELLRTGEFAYLSEEFGAIDPVTARAYPLERPIRIDQEALDLFPGLEPRLVDRREMRVRLMWRFIRAQDLGAETGRPATVGWIVLPSGMGQGPPRLSPVSTAEAVAEMARNSFNLHVYGDRGMHLLVRVARGARAFRLEGGTPAARAALLAEELQDINVLR